MEPVSNVPKNGVLLKLIYCGNISNAIISVEVTDGRVVRAGVSVT